MTKANRPHPNAHPPRAGTAADMAAGGPAGEDANNDRPFFEAMLTPHRSLARPGFVILMVLVGIVSLAHAAMFVVTGAWPVSIFFGLDLVLLFGAFWLNYRSGRAREEVSLSRTKLAIRKFAPSGHVTEHAFNPFWARLRICRHDEIGITGLSVSGGGHSTDVGAFLNPEDRESFAAAFSGALASAKRP